MFRWKKSYFCRSIVKVLVFLMVINGLPLWELGQSYEWVPRNFVTKALIQIVNILNHGMVEAASPPVADAGDDRILMKDQPISSNIVLDGTASNDPDSNLLTYQWYGPFIINSGPTPSVDIPEGIYTVSLIVDDGTTRSEVDTAAITITPYFNISDRAKSGKVQLTWIHQDDTERYEVYRANEASPFRFEKIGETTSTYSTYLDESAANENTYLYVVSALYQREWRYSNVVSSHPTALRTRVPVNYAPVIYSSSITHGTTGIIYNYDVNTTDPNGDVLSYNLVDHPAGMEMDLTTGLITWTPNEAGSYNVTAEVGDGKGEIKTQSFTITVENIDVPKRPPVAIAGPDQTVFVTDTVQLDGSGSSDMDGDQLTYQWSFMSVPAGSGAVLSDVTAVNPTFEIDIPGAYIVQLIVNDGLIDSEPDTVTISTYNSTPVADAGSDQTAFVTDTVQLYGSNSSDVDGDLLTFNWFFTSIPTGSDATFSDSMAVNPTFVIDMPGTYVVQLIVNDGTIDSAPDSVAITTESSPPVADAGPDQTVFVGDTVTLDGSMSSDVDGDLLTFNWSLTSIPDESMAKFHDPASASPVFLVDKPGSYIVQLIVNDGTADSDPVTVSISTENSPPVANAGPDQTVFVTEPVQLDGSASSDVDGHLLTFTWSFISRPEGSKAMLSDPTAVNPTFAANEAGSYVVQLIVNDGTVNSNSDTVTISTENSPSVANAGHDQTLFITDIVELDGSGSSDVDGDILTYQWSFISVPGGSTSSLSDPTAINPSFIIDLPGIYTVQLIVNDGTVDSAPDSVVINTQNSRPVANAGSDQTVFVGDTVTLDGSGSSDFDDDPLTYQWAFTSIPSGSGATLSDPVVMYPQFDIDLLGTYVVQLIVNDGELYSDPDTVTITATEQMITVPDLVGMGQVAAETAIIAANLSIGNITTQNSVTMTAGNVISHDPGPGALVTEGSAVDLVVSLGPIVVNRDPEIISAPVTSAGVDVLYTYNVKTTDPDGDSLTYFLTTAPSGMFIDAGTGLITWIAGTGDMGTHSIVIEVSDGKGGTDTQPYTILVSATVNRSPDITSIPVTSAFAGLSYQYNVQATDQDGYPLTFSLTKAPAGMSIGIGTGIIEWIPDTTQTGSHDVTVKVEDTPGAFDTQSFTVNVVLPGDIVPPDVTVTVNPAQVNPDEPATVTVIATDDVGVASIELLVNGTSLTLDGNNQTIFSSVTPGLFTVTATARDAEGNEGISSEHVRVLAPSDITAPVLGINSPTTDSEITSPTDIIGTASDENLVSYRLELSPKNENQWTVFAEGTISVTNDILGTFDSTQLLNGLYDVRLTAEDANGQESSTSVVYRVTDDLKVGNFTITLEDLAIPMAGIPITINRTYDSRDKVSHDFGYGWSQSIQTTKLEENRVLGTSWIHRSTGGLFPTYYLQSNDEHYVSIAFPDGRVEEFDFTPTPTSSWLVPLTYVTAGFTARPGTFSTLVPLGNKTLAVGADELMGWLTFEPYDPDEYQLTTGDGTVYIISQTEGIKSITELNGNTITFTANGIIHSSGKSVTFVRDAQSRITKITDPNGGTITYEYDFRGDLIATTDQEENTIRYHYNSSHGLTGITDPRGITPAQNVYDDEGRLIAHIDAYGNRIKYTHNVDARQEVVRDRLGNISVYEYDDDGNVLSETDSLGNTTTYTYDENGNKESKTDALGNTTNYKCDDRGNEESRTDPVGNKTSWTYNEKDQLLTTTDPMGNITRTNYDANGNLHSKTDPMGNTTTNEYDPSGNLTSSTDCFGATTYEYDSFGNKIKEIDPLDHETIYSYDANGNELSKTTTRTSDAGSVTMTTRKYYDNLNRLSKTIDSHGNETITEYNAIGKKSAVVDKNGNCTTYEYDPAGKLTKTTYPDGSTEITSYDANGNRITSTDRAGRTTRYEYDPGKYGDIKHPAGNRLTRTIFPDGSSTRLEYDAARLTATIDENGSRVSYRYDAAGRRTRVTDALGNVTTLTYDTNGNEESITDANGNTIIYEYDALNRRIKTLLPNGTFTAVKYAGCGTKRKASETDQAGNTTRFEYDALGRLTKVIDAIGGETTYSYDEAGNKLTQTDPNGNTTRWAYDNLGRILKHTLPMGMYETFTYDPNSNLIAKTDFNGDTITYRYDVNNHLIKKSYPDDSEVLFTYTATGRRQTVTDTRGITLYRYDLRDRLVEVIYPDGTSIAYEYDLKGNRKSVDVPSGKTIYTYDTLNRLETVTDPDGGLTGYTYDSAGNRASVTYPNGTMAEYNYDTLNRLTYIENRKSTGEVISSYTYTLGPAGNRTRVEENSGRVVNYIYDNLYRLREEQITDPVLGDETISYTYDAFGNRMTRTDSTGITNYTYNANDQLVTEATPDYTNTFTYDGNGNTKRKSDGTIITDYNYNYENKLIVAQTGDSQISYAYDTDGIRVESISDGAVTHYLVDKNRPFAQVLEEADGNGALIVSYVYGDDLISQNRSGISSYYHYDGQMSTRELTNADEEITNSYVYDAFGILIDKTGTTENNYLYTGEQYDPNVGFYYLRARYYNPENGRFMTHDPRWGSPFEPMSLHKYLYANANPIKFVDPSGEVVMAIFLVAALVRPILFPFLAASLASLGERWASRRSIKWSGLMSILTIGAGNLGFGILTVGLKSECPKTTNNKNLRGMGVYELFMTGFLLSPSPIGLVLSKINIETPEKFGPDPKILIGPSTFISLTEVVIAGWSSSILIMGKGISGSILSPACGFDISAVMMGGVSIPLSLSDDWPCS